MVLETEAKAIMSMAEHLDGNFARAVELCFNCRGKVVTTGVGKSGLIARKVSATLSSTGTPSFFLHPTDAVHGDLGALRTGDVAVAFSYSGETSEVVGLVPSFRRLSVPLISFVGNVGSTLARESDVVVHIALEREACPYGLVPTASSTSMLALGDALAIVLMQMRGFTPEDFAAIHPSGALGNRLLLRVKDIMSTGSSIPVVSQNAPVKEALFVMTDKGLGTVLIAEDGCLCGIVTDGDIRRALERTPDLLQRTVSEIMTRRPVVVGPDALATEALKTMQDRRVNVLPIVDDAGRVVGVIHIQQIIRAGIV